MLTDAGTQQQRKPPDARAAFHSMTVRVAHLGQLALAASRHGDSETAEQYLEAIRRKLSHLVATPERHLRPVR